ncbi:hypothetical protein [Microbacterium luticocti]|uniref:hypothetical protein n=1 Tax=Microbacterium luticocti TaxID=451764 RepID=UPI000402A7A9|nr:hypothetical protein [Microbacterium luticocti]
MQFPRYLAMLVDAERALSDAYRDVSAAHAGVADASLTCRTFAAQALERAIDLARIGDERYPADGDDLDDLRAPALGGTRSGPLGLVRDLQELAQLCAFVQTSWQLAGQAASGLRDHDLIALAAHGDEQSGTELAWIHTKLKNEAAQALLVAE